MRDKLRKIETLFAGAATPGERQAAGAAAERIRLQLAAAARTEPEIEMRFSIPNPWLRRLFIALCRRLRPEAVPRYARMKPESVVVKAPHSFLERTLWPQFVEIDRALTSYLDDVTDKVILAKKCMANPATLRRLPSQQLLQLSASLRYNPPGKSPKYSSRSLPLTEVVRPCRPIRELTATAARPTSASLPSRRSGGVQKIASCAPVMF